MQNKKIIVNINNNGKVYVETENYKGESCVENIKKLFSQFIDIDTNIEKKSDYYDYEETLYGGIDLKL